jgi:hypothetical protein
MLLPILLTGLPHAPSSLTLIDLHKSEQMAAAGGHVVPFMASPESPDVAGNGD